jgi:hypothetical protein
MSSATHMAETLRDALNKSVSVIPIVSGIRCARPACGGALSVVVLCLFGVVCEWSAFGRCAVPFRCCVRVEPFRSLCCAFSVLCASGALSVVVLCLFGVVCEWRAGMCR